MVVMDDSVGTRPESVVNRRGSRGPLRGGVTKAPLTCDSPRGLCWVRKKSSISCCPLLLQTQQFSYTGRANWTAVALLYKSGKDLRSAVWPRPWRSPTPESNCASARPRLPQPQQQIKEPGHGALKLELLDCPSSSMLEPCQVSLCRVVGRGSPTIIRCRVAPLPSLRHKLHASRTRRRTRPRNSRSSASGAASGSAKETCTDLEKQILLAHATSWRPGATAKGSKQ
jgi:hypothetical protein